MNKPSVQVDREAFEAAALPHLDACYGFALRLTRNVEEAEDLVQDAILRALQYFHRFEPGTNFRAWIFKVLLNTFINSYRKGAAAREGPSSHNLELLHERMVGTQGPHPSSDPERAAIGRQAARALHEALEKLPEAFRTVVHLADIEGCAYKEIASILGCPIGTVMSRLHRARRLLQAALVTHAPHRISTTTPKEEESGESGRADSQIEPL